MAKYFVTWEMDIEADSPEEAAVKALYIHRDPESVATVFKVKGETEPAKLYDVAWDDEACDFVAEKWD